MENRVRIGQLEIKNKRKTNDDQEFNALNFWMFQIIMYLIKNILIAKGILCFKARKSISP